MKLNDNDVECAVGFITTRNRIHRLYIKPIMSFVRGAIAYIKADKMMRQLVSDASFDRNRHSAFDRNRPSAKEIIERHEFRTNPPQFMIEVPWGDDSLASELSRLQIRSRWYSDGEKHYFIFENETDYIAAQLIK